MSRQWVVTGTDTDIGKTVFAAGLAGALEADYWKPVQAGLEDGTDSEAVLRLSGLPADHILPETYRLKIPASPHYSAAQEGLAISADDLVVPETARPLVIEGAGGALVPINENFLYADLFARWKIPTIIVASTRLGTINHSLLTIEALRARAVPILGIAFIGDAVSDSQSTICAIGKVPELGRLPILSDLSADTLAAAFKENFNLGPFAT
ncbi:MAG: dethiobiotin synthase [Pseudomonadota bacterium]